jgi:hypothetical protein
LAIAAYHQDDDWRELRDIVLTANRSYRWMIKGVNRNGKPMMIHFWT